MQPYNINSQTYFGQNTVTDSQITQTLKFGHAQYIDNQRKHLFF